MSTVCNDDLIVEHASK